MAAAAASSASGESGMVSREDMLGLRERVDVGVDGTEEEKEEAGKAAASPRRMSDGYGSLKRAAVGARSGEECAEPGALR